MTHGATTAQATPLAHTDQQLGCRYADGARLALQQDANVVPCAICTCVPADPPS